MAHGTGRIVGQSFRETLDSRRPSFLGKHPLTAITAVDNWVQGSFGPSGALSSSERLGCNLVFAQSPPRLWWLGDNHPADAKTNAQKGSVLPRKIPVLIVGRARDRPFFDTYA